MVASFDIVKPSRCCWDNDVRLKGHGKKAVRGGKNYDAAQGWDYLKFVSRLPAESTDDIPVRDPPRCVHSPDTVKHCGVA